MTAAVDLAKFEYSKEHKTLYGVDPARLFDLPYFPNEFMIRSHHTGEVFTFRRIDENHPAFDPDHWDGEMQIYEPVVGQHKAPINVALVVITYG